MRLFGSLTKIEDQPDGTLKVFGVASTGARDDAGEIVLPEAMKAALPDYARYPALREMHQPTAAGRTLEAEVDDDGATRIVAHVVDPVAIAKVKSRTYAGFSIGGRVLQRDPKDRTVITKIKLSEISLVDRPANPEAVIDLWKADAAAGPSNEAVKTRAAELARRAGRPGSWKDYVAKARAALVDEQDDGPDGPDDDSDAPVDQTAPLDGFTVGPQDDNAPDTEDDAAPDLQVADEMANDVDEQDGDASDSERDDGATDLATRLAALAGQDPARLQAAHDILAALGAACDPNNCPYDAGKAIMADDLAKTLPRVEALERRLAQQAELIERLAAMPLPPRAAASAHARAVGKADDADPTSDPADLTAADAQKAFSALTADERAFLLMKASLRQPIPVL